MWLRSPLGKRVQKIRRTFSSLRFHRRLRIASVAFGASAMVCTPFKEDTPGDSGLIVSTQMSPSDARPGATPDAGAGPACDLSKPFGPPAFVQGLANTGATQVGGLRLTPDSLTGYFDATYSAPSGAVAALYTGTRTTPGAPFESFAPLGDSAVNALADEVWPTVSSDGFTLVFARFYQQAYHLHYGTRSSTSVPFGYAGPVSGNDPAAQDRDPFLREDGEDGKVLYFTSNRSANSDWDIYRAAWNGSSLGPAVPVVELNTAFQDNNPTITPDDLTIYIGSTRPPTNAQNGQIWMATRVSTSAPFSAPANVTELNSGEPTAPTYVARGGCTLYFETLTAQYMAEKPPR